MDSHYTWWRFAEERHQEMLRAAERARLESSLGRRRRRGRASVQRLPLWLGERLVSWGERLQRRYGEMPSTPAFQSTPRNQGRQLP